MNISIIAALSINKVIGINNSLPWNIKEDLKYFKSLTNDNYVIMGRNTYESIGKPLPNRLNIIISRNKKLRIEGCLVVNSLEEAIFNCIDKEKKVFIIGGSSIYQEAIKLSDTLFLTEIQESINGDSYFPHFNKLEWEEESRIISNQKEPVKLEYHFVKYNRIKK